MSSLKWVNVNEKYLDFLRNYEKRIPKTDYGNDKYKPFFGIFFETDDFYYITQISHAQTRHQKMKNSLDFFKVYDVKDSSRLLAVVNLNYMFPIPKLEVVPFIKSNIEKYRSFSSNDEKNKYIQLLNTEIKSINAMDLPSAAKKLYNMKYKFPQHKISQRCLDYKQLEKYGAEWIAKMK